MVFGYKSAFKNEDEFKREVSKLHIEQVGCECIVGKIKCEKFIIVDKTLQGEYMYPMKDSGVEIERFYYADVEEKID